MLKILVYQAKKNKTRKFPDVKSDLSTAEIESSAPISENNIVGAVWHVDTETSQNLKTKCYAKTQDFFTSNKSITN